MLDVITDFWKPVKKGGVDRLDLSRLQVGSDVVFGAIPQPQLSGRTCRISGVNTYQFGREQMISYLLSTEKDDTISLIVAGGEEDPYLALSRRVPFTERLKMFDPAELDAIMEQQEDGRLSVKNIENGWRAWLVSSYRKQIGGVRGALAKGDMRQQLSAPTTLPQPFDYALLTSDNNEYAIEIERYSDGRMEIYATVYRRISDVLRVESSMPASAAPPAAPAAAGPRLVSAPLPEAKPHIIEESVRVIEPEVQEPAAPEEVPEERMDAVSDVEEITPQEEAAEEEEHFPEAESVEEELEFEETVKVIEPPKQHYQKEPTTMPPVTPISVAQEHKSPFSGNVLKAGTSAPVELENDAVECSLPVANRIIEEAIRNEMRLSDVVRRVIALPLANPESVQIPVTLSENDYQLLAIRYGVSATDHNTIKIRIMEELSEFSGKK